MLMRYQKNMRRVLTTLLILILTTAFLIIPPVKSEALTSSNALGPVTSKDVVYQILTDRFYDGDTSNNIPAGFNSALFDGTGNNLKLYQGGDWQGIINKIPYLKNMGVTAVWISAPYENFDSDIDGWASYHGYHVRNYFATNKHFGNMSDFIAMRDALHNNGIKLVIDFVSNHTSNRLVDGKLYAPDIDSSGNYTFDSNGEPYDYNNDGIIENLIANPNAPSTDPKSWWFHHEGNRADNETSKFEFRYKDLANLGDFSQEYSVVVDHLEKAMKFWKSKGVDGFRHDATKHENVAFVAGLRDAVDSATGGPVSHFGEYFIGRPDPNYGDYIDFPNRTGVNNLDFEFYNAAKTTFGSFSTSMSDFGQMLLHTADDYDIENQAVTFIDNHDVVRFRYLQPNDKAFHAGLAALLTSRGIPCIYYGTEQYVSGSNNDEGRVFMQKKVAFNEQTTAFKLIKSMSDLRQSNDALAYGITSILYSTNDVLVFKRQFYDKQVIVAINRQPAQTFTVPALSTTLPAGVYTDSLNGLLYGQSITVSGGKIDSFSLEGGEVNVWSYNPDLGTTPKIGDVQAYTGRAGNTVYIYGTGLDGNITVKFDTTTATVVSNSATQIEAIVPNVASGVRTIKVIKNGVESNTFNYTVLGGDQVQVIFHVNNAETYWGQNIHVVGNIPELGNWDPQKSSEAAMSPNYPSWFIPVSVPKNTTIEFKFIKKDVTTGQVVWEDSISNRVVTSPSSDTGTLDVYCTWNSN